MHGRYHPDGIDLIRMSALALPAAGLLASALISQHRKRRPGIKIPLAFCSTVLVFGMFIFSIPNILFFWSVEFMVTWPLLGIALTLVGFLLTLFAPKGERWKYAVSNFLLLTVSYASITVPN